MSYEEWMTDAACTAKDVDPDVFFSTDLREIEIAKDLCAGCDVAAQCLDYALRGNEREGIFGGLSPAQRARLGRTRIA